MTLSKWQNVGVFPQVHWTSGLSFSWKVGLDQHWVTEGSHGIALVD